MNAIYKQIFASSDTGKPDCASVVLFIVSSFHSGFSFSLEQPWRLIDKYFYFKYSFMKTFINLFNSVCSSESLKRNFGISLLYFQILSTISINFSSDFFELINELKISRVLILHLYKFFLI